MFCRKIAVLIGALALAAISLPIGMSSAQADVLSDIKDKGEIVIATETRYPPFEFIENGEIVGYGPDMFHEIMEGLPGIAVDHLDLPWQSILPGLSAGRFDFVVTSVGISAERAKQYSFTYPIADATAALVKQSHNTSINSPDDLAGKVVGANAGSLQVEVLKRLSEDLESRTGEGIAEIKEYVDFNVSIADLEAGRVDAVSQPLPNLAYLVKQRPDDFALVLPTIGPKTYFAWVGRNEPESESLVQFFSDGLANLNKSGRMAELQRKWFGVEMEVPATAVVPEE